MRMAMTATAATIALAMLASRAEAEIITVVSCDAGKVLIGNPDDPDGSWCVDPRGYGPGGGSGPDGGGGPGGGGPSGPSNPAHRQTCKACIAEAAKCQRAAVNQHSLCKSTGDRVAESLCRIGPGPFGRSQAPRETVTPWGVSIADLVGGYQLPERNWNGRDWSWSCGTVGAVWPVSRGSYVCSGPGISSCIDSWRVSHPGGSTAEAYNGNVSFSFPPVGAATGVTVTKTLTFNGANGWLSACANAFAELSQACSSQLNRCAAKNDCSPEDMR